jgi:predicted alpha/beta-hydrolase family hydrolase
MNPGPQPLIDGPKDARWSLILAHGAGQGMRSEFMQWFAFRLANAGHRVVRFEFPYMQASAADGKRRPPNPQPRLIATWRWAIRQELADGSPRERLVIGGKSLGGRIASLVADEEGVAGLVCLGYPFHPPGKSEIRRTEHLKGLRTPALICQGERDPFGNRSEVSEYSLSSNIRFCWLADGDHGFKPRKASEATTQSNWELAAAAILKFLDEL